VETLPLPEADGSNVKGLAADPRAAMLYISYGGDGGNNGQGSLLKYDLGRHAVVWARAYGHGVDSMALSTDGQTLYMPVGEEEKASQHWNLIDAATGDESGGFEGARAPHNTIVPPTGKHVYLGGREDKYMYVRNTRDGSMFSLIGPFLNSVRPFSVNGAETL